MAASRHQPVQKGGMWSTPKANYSKDTQNLLKEMMRESRLTNFQQRQLNSVLAGGGTLPENGVRPTTSARPKVPSAPRPRQLPKVLNGRNASAQIRTKDTIEQSGAYERDRYIPAGPSYYAEDKEKFINKLTYGEDLPPPDWKKILDRIDPDPVPEKDRFAELEEEVEERQKFLRDMIALGQGKKYETIIRTEVSQKIREMEVLDKKRTAELEKRLASQQQN